MTRLEEMFGSPDAWSGLSASAAGATIECPTRLAFPGAHTKGEAADRGNELHAFARVVTINPGAREVALAKVPEKWRHTAAGMNLDAALDGLRVTGCERAYAVDVKKRTTRYIGDNIGRDYNGELKRKGLPLLSRYEIPFTIDVEAFVDDVPVELDYKSGQSIGDPSEHWQRRVCASGLIYYYDSASAISRVAYIWDSGDIKHDGCEFSILDAEEYCETLVTAIDMVWKYREMIAAGIMPPVFPSDSACQYCSAKWKCPAIVEQARIVLGKVKSVVEGPDLTALTQEELGEAWRIAKEAEKLIEPLFEGLKKIAAVAPLLIDEKFEVRPVTKSRSFFDNDGARGLIVKLMSQAGKSDEEIAVELAKLQGKREYDEYRKVKRQLPMVAA